LNDSPAIRDDGDAVSDMLCWFRLLTSQKMTLCCAILMMFVQRYERQQGAESIFGVKRCELGRVRRVSRCGLATDELRYPCVELVISDTHCLM